MGGGAQRLQKGPRWRRGHHCLSRCRGAEYKVRSRGSGEHSRMRPCVQGTEPCRVPLGPGWKGTCSPSGVYDSVLSH